MQKYINIGFIVALVALGFYIVRLQVFNGMQSVQLEINNQQGRIQSLSTNIKTIADFLNQQAELSAKQTKGQAPAPAAQQ
ncbi:MAG: hypothetical protein HYT31_02500 [Parcubacteria group bacterium]|nr:hypothetical protein [Parcubacteria group bacterium]